MKRRYLTLGKLRLVRLALLCLGLICIILSGDPLYGQEILGIHPTGRAEDRLPLPKDLPPEPREPVLRTPPPSPERRPGELPSVRVFVRKIEVAGSSAFSAEELAQITSPYENRELTSEDLEALRRALTLNYIERGYVNSGAIIPDQNVGDGVIRFEIVEGELTDIDVEGNRWFREGYFKSRIALAAGMPLNINSLEKRLQLLQEDERFNQLHAELKPGLKLGQSELRLRVEENLPFSVLLGFNNYQSPTVGAERGFATIAHNSLSGHGDRLGFTYGRSEGIDPQIDAWYSLPFTARDTTITLRYSKNDFIVIEEPFGPLDIESKSDTYEVTLRHPLYQSLNHEFALALTGERLHNETSLLGEPFSFSLGAEDGKSTVTALRLSQEWTYRTQRRVMAARSRFSLGVDALGATIRESSVPDGRFFSWLGQFQWASLFEKLDIQTIFRADIQLSNDSLLALEQMPVGGRFSVRGYRENQLVRDNALILSFETRIPLVQHKSWADYIQLAPFIDFGRGWNTDLPTPKPDSIGSVGLGLRWAATLIRKPFPLTPQFEIYWGHQLRDIDSQGDNLQDDGIHLQFVISAF